MTDKINGRTPEEIKKGQTFSEYLDEKLSKVNIASMEDEDQEQKKRTPEEIKRGLSLCYADVCDCSECPYFNTEDCDKKLASDVLMLFQQLEAERDQYKRERDAAVRDMRDATLCGCHVCKHYYRPDANVRIYACRKFGEFGKFDYIKDDGSMFCGAFEWRGPEVE